MKIETKYSVGDKLFWLNKNDGIWRINYDPIKSINIGGKAHKKYEISYTSRAERDLFTDFKEAKSEALKRQKEDNRKYEEIISEYKEPINNN